ncbi:MAG: RHS repeat-associated core domain-containing protein, partial [Steroidobacter sp.]
VTAIDTPEGSYGLSYDALSRRTSLTYPNGTAVQYTYNNLNQLTGLRFTGAFNETLDYTYGNDSLLRQRSSSQATWNYGYDADGQLSTAASGAQSFTYQYDGSGNRVGSGRVYDNANRLTADADFTYTYDASGNLVEKRATADGARTLYFWNERGLLRAVERYVSAAAATPDQRLEFTYDALGRRTSRVAGGVSERYVYSGQDRVATLDATGRITERVTHGPNVDEPLSLHGDQGARFLHADHLGTIIGASSASSVLERYEYGPFGEALGSAAAMQNAYRYTAREAEAPDLYYYRARYYDPTVGRFISEDPLGIASGETNLYRYAANNPIHAADPTGEAIWFIVPIIWGAVEIGLAIYDAYDTGSTLLDPCASGGEKWLAGGLFLLGAVLPGGGYSAADDIVVIGRQWDTAVAKDWPGHNVLDVSDWSIGKNDAWVKDAIDRNSPVYIASPTTPANMFDDVAGRETVFGREYQQFLDAGYTQQGDYLIPPP